MQHSIQDAIDTRNSTVVNTWTVDVTLSWQLCIVRTIITISDSWLKTILRNSHRTADCSDSAVCFVLWIQQLRNVINSRIWNFLMHRLTDVVRQAQRGKHLTNAVNSFSISFTFQEYRQLTVATQIPMKRLAWSFQFDKQKLHIQHVLNKVLSTMFWMAESGHQYLVTVWSYSKKEQISDAIYKREKSLFQDRESTSRTNLVKLVGRRTEILFKYD